MQTGESKMIIGALSPCFCSNIFINSIDYSCWCRANNVLPCRPPGTVLDIKKSSHKKLSKWLQSKSSEGLVLLFVVLLLFSVF